MRHHYRISDLDIEKMESHPDNEKVKEARFFDRTTYRTMFINILYEMFGVVNPNNGVHLHPNDQEIAFDFQLSGSQLLELQRWGVGLTEFNPKKRDIEVLKSKLADELAENIKNGYYDIADKIYALIKEL
jgi:hypothetical protein